LIENVPGRTVHFITVPFVMLCHADGSKCARKDRPLCHALSRRGLKTRQEGPSPLSPFVMLCHAGGSKCARKDRPLCQSPLSRFVEEVFDGVVEVLFVLVDDVGGGADGFGEGFGVCAPVEGFVDGFFGVDLGR